MVGWEVCTSESDPRNYESMKPFKRCVCVCVCVREREREREGNLGGIRRKGRGENL